MSVIFPHAGAAGAKRRRRLSRVLQAAALAAAVCKATSLRRTEVAHHNIGLARSGPAGREKFCKKITTRGGYRPPRINPPMPRRSINAATKWRTSVVIWVFNTRCANISASARSICRSRYLMRATLRPFMLRLR